MAYSLQNTTDLSNLGDAIRAKTGGSSNMTVAEMATAVASITSGGGTLTISYEEKTISSSATVSFNSLTLTGDASKTNIWIIPLRYSISTSNTYTKWLGYPAIVIRKPNSNPVCLRMSGSESNTNSPWSKYSSISASGNNVTISFSNYVYSSENNAMWYLSF